VLVAESLLSEKRIRKPENSVYTYPREKKSFSGKGIVTGESSNTNPRERGVNVLPSRVPSFSKRGISTGKIYALQCERVLTTTTEGSARGGGGGEMFLRKRAQSVRGEGWSNLSTLDRTGGTAHCFDKGGGYENRRNYSLGEKSDLRGGKVCFHHPN